MTLNGCGGVYGVYVMAVFFTVLLINATYIPESVMGLLFLLSTLPTLPDCPLISAWTSLRVMRGMRALS